MQVILRAIREAIIAMGLRCFFWLKYFFLRDFFAGYVSMVSKYRKACCACEKKIAKQGKLRTKPAQWTLRLEQKSDKT